MKARNQTKYIFAGKYEYYLLIVLIVTVTVIHLIWIRQDTRPQPFIDPYPQKTLAFIDRLESQGLQQVSELVEQMTVGPRPPLYQLLTVPFFHLVGRTVDAMLMVNVLFNIVLMVCTFGIGTLVKNRKAGLLSALIVATYPPIVNLVKIARPQSIAPACVALNVWLLLLLLKTRSPKIAWFYGISLAFGFWIHPNLFYVLGLPSVLLGVYMVFFQTSPRCPSNLKQVLRWLLRKLRDRFVIYGLIPAGLIAIGITAIWYFPRIDDFIIFKDLMAWWYDVRYGFDDIPVSFWWYARTMPGVISYVFAVLLIIGLAITIIKPQGYRTGLTLLFLLIYGTISTRKGSHAWMNAALMLPVAAVISATWIVHFHDFCTRTKRIYKPFATILLVGSIIVAGFNFFVVTWGIPPYTESLCRILGAPLNESACSWRMNVALCPNPPRNEDWRINDIIQTIRSDCDRNNRRCSLSLVGENLDAFHRSSFGYCRVQDFPGFRMKLNSVFHRRNLTLSWLTSYYVAYIPQARQPNIRPVIAFLTNPSDAFRNAYQEIARFSLPDGQEAVLIKRTKALTFEQVVGVLESLDISQGVKSRLVSQAKEQFPASNGRNKE